MDRSSVIVPAICAAALAGAVFAVLLVSARASREGTPELTRAAKALVDELEGDRVDLRRVQALLAPGLSTRDPRVRDAIENLAGEISKNTVVSKARATQGDTSGETELILDATARRRPLRSKPDTHTLRWTRDPEGRWGLDLLAR